MKLHKFGPYQTEELLGRGGMGTVYRGVHEQTRQVVALKVLSFIHADDDNFRERFGLEIETLKKQWRKLIPSLGKAFVRLDDGNSRVFTYSFFAPQALFGGLPNHYVCKIGCNNYIYI